MILHSGVLALLVGSVAVLLFALLGSALGVQILRHWDPASASERQLILERRTYLVSTLMNYALGFTVASALLFVVTADDIHGLLVGAMCATGSLNANPVGWSVLWLKLGLLFAGGVWIALNVVDNRCEDYPYTRLKYALLLVLLPAIAADLVLLLRYFLGLHPDIITSCCGSLFTTDASGPASTLASLPPVPMMSVFYATAGGYLVLGWVVRRRGAGWFVGLFSLASLAWFSVSLASIVAFVAPYVYQLPTHHCPFDVFQRGYHYIGHPLFGSLFVAAFFGLLPGAFQVFGRRGSAVRVLARLQRRWIGWSLAATLVFVAIVSYPVWFGGVRLFGLD